MERGELARRVFEAGVVGAGGAGFPTHVKLAAEGIDTYLINGAECEPLLTVDQHLMEAEAPRLVRAAASVAEALGATRAVFGLKKKYRRQIDALRAAGGEVAEVGNTYPAGDEVILIQEVLGRTVPEGGLPLMVGAVVNNPETLLNVAEALEGRPVTHTYVTLGGAVASRGVWRVPVGTDGAELLAAAGGVTEDDPAYIEGGPMTGKYRFDPHFPVTKATKGLLVVPRTSALVRYETLDVERMLNQARVACCQCVQCTLACSRNLVGYDLEPHRIMRLLAYGPMGLPEVAKQAFLCSECNLCSGLHACPMQLSPRRVNQVLKARMREAGIRPDFPRREIEPRREQPYRQVPSHRLVQRLGLERYEGPSPFRGDLRPSGDLTVLLKQHAGVPAVPCVAPGQVLEAGALLGSPPEGALGARVHAPLGGQVVRVTPEAVILRPAAAGQEG